MNVSFEGGINIAMKVPAHEYEQVMVFYRDVVRLPEITEKAPATGFKLGPNQLWIDRDDKLTQAEVWLELFTPDHEDAAQHLAMHHTVRCDTVEPLGPDFKGFWIMNPANIVHMVRRADAW